MKTLYIILVIHLFALTSLLLDYYTLLDIERGVAGLGTDLLEVRVEWLEKCLKVWEGES